MVLLVGATANLAMAGEVRGQIKFDGSFGEPPERTQGFVPRIANPIRPVQPFDPTPYLVVVLEGGPDDDEAKNSSSSRVEYGLLGESFEVPLLAVSVGTEVRIRNLGPRKVVLSAPDFPDLVDQAALDPRQTTAFKVAKASEVIVVGAPARPHPEGRIVGFASRYFAMVDTRGRFAIDKVPEGTWKVRLWYRDGWVKGVEDSVTVSRRGGEVTLRVAPNQLAKSRNN